jgi:acyl-CoA dehydrogenase
MSVPYSLLANSAAGHVPASQRVPVIARPFMSERAMKTLDIVRLAPFPLSYNSSLLTPLQVEKFVEEDCIPADAVFMRQLGETTEQRFSSHPSVIEDLKKRARELGLWNMFLPKAHFKEGAGFSNLEYGIMAEYLGKSRTASEVSAWCVVVEVHGS